MRRRAIGIAAVAALAAAAGGATAWWRSRLERDAPPERPIDLWQQTFQDPDGSPVRMAEWRGRPLLLNFWATWCGPCVTEMPLLDRFASERAASGWRVLALAVDSPDPVRRFLAERLLKLPVAITGAPGIELSRSLGNTQGALPFTVVFDRTGAAVGKNLGAVTPTMLADWAEHGR